VATETEQDRTRRRHRRTLFDDVAQLYQDCRLGYPADITNFLVATAAVSTGSPVLEIGCGTGQLTENLERYGFSLTAIDIGPSMIEVARRRFDGSSIRFQAVSFEDFTSRDSAFDLIVSATAFHWIDPEVRFAKSARLLRSGGWLALLATAERYHDPFGAALLDLWIARSEDGGTWARQPKPSDDEIMARTGLFERPVQRAHSREMARPAQVVIGTENTRATSLSWPAETRQEFTEELKRLLRDQAEVPLTQHTSLTMARAL
jgi:ubiquinone/menaquinone biosynthesis C-methylase UbiE